MSNKEKMLLGGFIAFMFMVTLRPAHSANQADEAAGPFINKVAVTGEDARLENHVEVREAVAGAPTHNAGTVELHCNYLPGESRAGDKIFRFADGNRAVFPAAANERIRFVAQNGDRTKIEGGEGGSRKNWWCLEDGVVLFSTVQGADGNLSGVKVEWFDSRGARKTQTRVNVAPYGEKVNWSYESARLVDECMGLTFRVQDGKFRDPKKSAKLVEYKLCPKGI